MHKFIAKYLMFLPGQWLRGENVLKHIRELERAQWKTTQEIENDQLVKFKKLIKFSYENTAHYRQLYDEHNIQVENINSLNDLLGIPCLTKDDLKYKSDQLVVKDHGKRVSKKSTGGSTGQSVPVIKDRDSMARQDAAMWRALRWYGIDIGDKQARFWGIPIDRKTRLKNVLIDFLMNRVRLSAFDMSETTMIEFVKKIKRFRPVYIYGYVNMIKVFAQFCEQNNINAREFNLKHIVTTSEPLNDETKLYIERLFGCSIINDYGSGEVGPIAYTCPNGGFHLMSDNLLVEIVTMDGRHAKMGESGEVIVTELNNYVCPMIRYKMKDIVVAAESSCSCGRGLHTISEVFGRDRDVLIGMNGNRVHGAYINYVVSECINRGYYFKEYQIIQIKKNLIKFRLVQAGNQPEVLYHLIELLMKNKLGDEMEIEFEAVKLIEREKSGKLRVVKCEILDYE